MLSVVFITRSTLYDVNGGDTIQVLATASHLRKLGVMVDIKLTSEKINYANYHLLHFFNITRPADILCHIQRSGKPFVVSPILINYGLFDKYHRKGLSGMLFSMLPGHSIEYAKTVARWVLGKDTLVSRSYLWKGQQKTIRYILHRTSMLLPNSNSEYTRLVKAYPFHGDFLTVVNGIDSSIFQYDEEIEKDPLLVICAARIEGIKNQLTLIRALNNTRFRLMLIGKAAPGQYAYYQACRKAAAENISFIDHLPQESLSDWYQKAKVHVLPSWFETTGLSSLEAGALGCNIVITENGDTRSYFGDEAFYCNPASELSILEAVEKAAELPVNGLLRKKILANYTWQQAALQTLSAYQKVYAQSYA